jgi:hypothetical protein
MSTRCGKHTGSTRRFCTRPSLLLLLLLLLLLHLYSLPWW